MIVVYPFRACHNTPFPVRLCCMRWMKRGGQFPRRPGSQQLKRWPWQRGRLRFQLHSHTAVLERGGWSCRTLPSSTSPTPTSKVKNEKKGYPCVVLRSAIVNSLLRESQTSRHQSSPPSRRLKPRDSTSTLPTRSAGQSHLKSGPRYTITYVCMSARETASPREGQGPDQTRPEPLPSFPFFFPSRKETSQENPQYKKKLHNTKESV